MTHTTPKPAAELSDEQIIDIARTMPMQPWGIGSRRQDALEFARAILAAATPQPQALPELPTDEQIDALLNDLDDIARKYDVYQYGLPLQMDTNEEGCSPHAAMREAVRAALASQPPAPAEAGRAGGP